MNVGIHIDSTGEKHPHTKSNLVVIEEIIDCNSLAHVLDVIAEICQGKAEHLRVNWQDNAQAKAWERAGNKIARLANGPLV